MASIPAKVAERLTTILKRFQPILSSARVRDVNESDTVTIITDLLAELFGYDKYTEITKEYAIRGTWCDLAIKIEGQAQLLIEVKAIGLDLKDQHTKQAIDYAANKGIEWVVLTNGVIWRIYRVIFAKPIDQDLVAEIDMLSLVAKNQAHIEQLFLLSREGWVKSSLPAYYTQRQATNKFTLAASLLSDSVVDAIRKELRKFSPDVKVQNDEIRDVLNKEVLKREVVEGDKAEDAKRKVLGLESAPKKRSSRTRSRKDDGDSVENEIVESIEETNDTTSNEVPIEATADMPVVESIESDVTQESTE